MVIIIIAGEESPKPTSHVRGHSSVKAAYLLLFLARSCSLFPLLFLALALLEQRLRDKDLVLSRHSPIISKQIRQMSVLS